MPQEQEEEFLLGGFYEMRVRNKARRNDAEPVLKARPEPVTNDAGDASRAHVWWPATTNTALLSGVMVQTMQAAALPAVRWPERSGDDVWNFC